MANESRKSEEDPFRSKSEDKAKRISIGKTIISSDDVPEPGSTPLAHPEAEAALAKGNGQGDEPAAAAPATSSIPSLTIEEEKKIEQDAEAQLQDEVKKSLEKPALQRLRSSSNPAPAVQSRKKDESGNRLSLRIPASTGTSMNMPGAFD
jgi:hypothetical protein